MGKGMSGRVVIYVMDSGSVPLPDGEADKWKPVWGLGPQDSLIVANTTASVYDTAGVVIKLANAHVLTRDVMIAGHGFGGSVAMEAAKHFNERARKQYHLKGNLKFVTFGTRNYLHPDKIKYMNVVHYMFRFDSVLDSFGRMSSKGYIGPVPSFKTSSFYDAASGVCWLTSDVYDIKEFPKGTKDKIHGMYSPYISAHVAKGDRLTAQDLDAIHDKNPLASVLREKEAQLHFDHATGAISSDPTMGRDIQKKQFEKRMLTALDYLEKSSSSADLVPAEYLIWWNLCAFRTVFEALGGKVDKRLNDRIGGLFDKLAARYKGPGKFFNFSEPGKYPEQALFVFDAVRNGTFPPKQSGGGRSVGAVQAALLLVTIAASLVPR